MTFKALFLSFTLLGSFSTLEAASKNLCDELIASGKSSEANIKKCLAKYGESDFYKAEAQRKKWQTDVDSANKDQIEVEGRNIQIKKFTMEELLEAGFGKPFFATRIDYSNREKPKVKRITEGNALCKFLGYEKVVKSIISPQIKPRDAHENGLVIGTSFFGNASDSPEIYKDKKEEYMVRQYHEIICARLKVTDPNAARELEKIPEDVIALNDELNSSPKKPGNVNDGPRKPANGKEPGTGYNPPPWVKDDVAPTSSK